MTAYTLLLRITVPILAVAALVGQVAYIDALTVQAIVPGLSAVAEARFTVITVVVAHAVVSVVSAGLAVALAFRASDRSSGAPELALAIGAWAYLLAYPGVVVFLRPDPGALRVAFEAHFLVIETLGLVALLRFTSLFPAPYTGKHPVEGADSRTARFLRPFRAALHRPTVAWMAALLVPIALVGLTVSRGAPVADAALHPLMDVFRIALAVAVVLNLRDSWTAARAEDRGALAWLLAALSLLLSSVLLVIGGNILLSATAWADPPVAWRPILLDLGVLGFVAGLTASRLGPPGVDPLRVTRRIILATGLVMATLISATILEVLLSSGIFGPVALPPGLGAAIAAAGIGSVSPSLLRHFARLLDQWPGIPGPDGVQA
ncbi:MAG: hypothetical protein WEA34_11795 [Gemmatimonadota bacterium]